MATDIWTGSGLWSANADWSLGAPPTSAENAEIAGAVTLAGAGAARSVVVDASQSFAEAAAGALTLTGFFANQGLTATFQGAATLAGNLWVGAGVTISTAGGAAAVKAANLVTSGAPLLIQGGATAGSGSASLSLSGGPAGGLSGDVEIAGNATLAFAGAGPSVVDLNAVWQIAGAQAKLTFNNASAFNAFSANYGSLALDGGSSLGAGGVSVASTSAFLNAGAFSVDAVSGGDAGGSSVSFAGLFTNANAGKFTLGDTTLTSASTARFGSLLNQGSLYVQGSASGGAAATLTVGGALAPTLSGAWTIGGAATIAFASGAATTVQANSSLTVIGSAAALTSGGANALGGVRTNYGVIDFEGDTALGAGGVTAAYSSAFTNYRNAFVDFASGAGGSAIAYNAGLINYGLTAFGNSGLGGATTVTASSLANSGTLTLVGSATNAAQTQLTVAGAVAATVSGQVSVSGDAALAYASGAVTSVQNGSSLELDGGSARLISAGANALTKLATDYGVLNFQGDDDLLGLGGVTLTTTSGFTNAGVFNVDTNGSVGGSAIAFAGQFANYSIPNPIIAEVVTPFLAPGAAGGVTIGNIYLNQATTVGATSLLNEGQLIVAGSLTAPITATLAISGAANPALTGTERIEGDGRIVYGSGLIGNIQYGASLELDGAGAQVLTNGGAASALSALSLNYATLSLQGNSPTGSGGVTLTTTTGLTNDSQLQIDTDYGASGSAISLGGALTNAGVVLLGNYAVGSGATSLRTQGLTNYDYVGLGAGASAATIVSSGAATNYNDLYVQSQGALTVTGGAAFTQAYGTTQVSNGGALSAPTVVVNGGTLQFTSALTADDAIASFKIGALGDLEFDGAVDSARAVAFTGATGLLTLKDAAAFGGLVSGFVGNDMIDLAGVSVSSLSYSSGVLTVNLSGGGADHLRFSGAYATASFVAVADGTGGTDILHAPAAEDVWSNFGDWNANAGYWSLGVPTASRYAVVAGLATVTASQAETAQALTLLSGSSLSETSAATLTIGGFLDNAGAATLQGASTSIAGALVNTGSLTIGASTDVAVSAGAFTSQGSLTITGGATAGGPTSALSVAGAASATLAGYNQLSGAATLTFGSGLIRTVLKGATLSLAGAGAQALTNGGSASALSALSANYGVINLEGDTAQGAGGAQLASAAAFLNAGAFSVDTQFASGGSTVSLGALTDVDDLSSFTLGNAQLSADDLVSVAALTNEGALSVIGDDLLAPTFKAELAVAAGPSAILSGALTVSGDAQIAFAKAGGIASIQYGASLEIDGANAAVTAAAASALATLSSNAGTLALEGDVSYAAGGVALTTNAGFSNYGKLFVDSYFDGGASLVKFKGTWLNAGRATLGAGSLGAASEVDATALNNQGQLTVQGSTTDSAQALLAVSGAASAALVGQWQVAGDAVVRFGAGLITSIQSQSSLELDGAGAILTNNGAASALSALALNEGTLTLQGDNQAYGLGGASLISTAAFTNIGTFDIDQQSYDGASSAAFGAFANLGSLYVGTITLTGDDVLAVSALTNAGYLTLQGTLDGSHTTALTVSGAAAAGLTGAIAIGGYATLSYGGGAITSVQEGASLSLYGANATLLSAGASALTSLSANYGALDLEGDDLYQGLGGVTLSTTAGFSNDGTLQVDVNYKEGASQVTFSGLLRNAGSITLGNSGLAFNDLIQANGLANAGTIQIQGQTEVALAELMSTSAVTNAGTITIDAGGELAASGATYTQTAGSTTVNGGAIVANAVAVNGGVVTYQSAALGGVSAFSIGATGELQFDLGVAAADTVTYAGVGGRLDVGLASQFAGTIAGFAGNDIIDLTGVSVSGFSFAAGVLSLTVGGSTDQLKFAGSYTTASFTTMSDGNGGTFVLHT